MKKFLKLGVAVFMLAVSSAALEAKSGKLPKGAAPMVTDDIKKFYAGRSIDWKVAQVFWAEDGKAVGYYPNATKPDDPAFGEGEWNVVDNEMCFHLAWRGKDKTKPPFEDTKCHKLYVAGKKIWIENTKDEKQYQGDIWTGQEKKMRPGDIVSAKVTELKAKFGY